MDGMDKLVNGMADRLNTGMDGVFNVMREREMEPLDKLADAQATIKKLSKVIPVMMIADRSLKVVCETMGPDSVMSGTVSMASLFQTMACASIGCCSRQDIEQLKAILLDDKGELGEDIKLLFMGLHKTISMDEDEQEEVRSVAKEALEKYGK